MTRHYIVLYSIDGSTIDYENHLMTISGQPRLFPNSHPVGYQFLIPIRQYAADEVPPMINALRSEPSRHLRLYRGGPVNPLAFYYDPALPLTKDALFGEPGYTSLVWHDTKYQILVGMGRTATADYADEQGYLHVPGWYRA